MASNIYFQFIDSESNLLTGSKVVLRAYTPPYFDGSGSVSYGGPIQEYSDATGRATFLDVVPGVYKCSFSNANANIPSTNTLQNFANTIFYANIPDTSGSLVNGIIYIITGSINNTYNNTTQYSVSSSYLYFDGDRPIKRDDPNFVGINVGGLDVVSFLDNFFFPSIPATISINSGISYYETGSSPTVNINGSLTPNDSLVFGNGNVWRDGIVWYPFNGSYSTTDVGITTNHTYQAFYQVDGILINSNIKVVNLIYPVLYGWSTSTSLSGATLYSTLNKLIQPQQDSTLDVTADATYLYFAIPSTFSDLSYVLDSNLFQVLTSFNKSTVSVTSTGLATNWQTNYKVYCWQTIADYVGNWQFIF